MCISSHAHNKTHDISQRFTVHFRSVKHQHGHCFMSSFWHLENWGCSQIVRKSVDPWKLLCHVCASHTQKWMKTITQGWEADLNVVCVTGILVTKHILKLYPPEPARIRSDRVKAPGRSLLFPLKNSLLNLGWTIGKHAKSYLKK